MKPYAFALIAIVLFGALAFAANYPHIIGVPLSPRVLGCEESTQPMNVGCGNGCTGTGGNTIQFQACNIATGICSNTTPHWNIADLDASRIFFAKILLNGSAAFAMNYTGYGGNATYATTAAVCNPAAPWDCWINVRVFYLGIDYYGTNTSFNFNDFGYQFCAHVYLEENHFRDGTTSNFSITPHNLGGLRWSCTWNASANALYLPGSYTNGSWSLVPATQTQNVSLAIGTEIQNASIQYGSAECEDELGNPLIVYRSGCGYGMGCQDNGVPWAWAALIPESFRIINPNDGVRDSVASIPGVAYAHEEITGLRLRVVDAITYTDNVNVRSFRVNFTLPAQCSMAQTLKSFSQYSWTGVAGGMSLDENQVYTLTWAGDPIVCTGPANITLEINASESVWPPGVLESDTIAYSPAAVVEVLSPEFTIDNVQAFENRESSDAILNG